MTNDDLTVCSNGVSVMVSAVTVSTLSSRSIWLAKQKSKRLGAMKASLTQTVDQSCQR